MSFFSKTLETLKNMRPLILFLSLLVFGSIVWFESRLGRGGALFTLATVGLGAMLAVALDRALGNLGESRLEELLPLSILFSFLWGRVYFVGYFAHDEIGYFAAVGQNLFQSIEWLSLPINEHFQPVFKIIVLAIYSLFTTEYFGWALFAFVLALLTLQLFVRLLALCDQKLWTRVFIGLFFCVSLSFAEVHRWKAAGAPLFLSFAPFLWGFLLIVQVMKGDRQSSLSLWLGLGVLSFVTVFSSSLLAVLPVYLISVVVLVIRNAKQLRWLSQVFVLMAVISGVYLFWRSHLVETQLRFPSFDPFSMIGLYLNAAILKYPSYLSRWVGVAVVVIAGLSAYFAAKRNDRLSLFLLVFGGTLFVMGAAQLLLGRGVVIPVRFLRYLFLPTFGCLLILSPILNRSSPKLLMFATVVLLGVAGIHWGTLERFYPRDRDTEIIQTRGAFFGDLKRALCAAYEQSPYAGGTGPFVLSLPDPGLSESPVASVMHIEPPFGEKKFGGGVKFYAQALGSRCFHSTAIRFVDPERMNQEDFDRLPKETQAFYQKYFEFYREQ